MQYRGSYAETFVHAVKATLVFASPFALMIVAMWAISGSWPKAMTQVAIGAALDDAMGWLWAIARVLWPVIGGTAAVFAVGMWAMHCWNCYVKRGT